MERLTRKNDGNTPYNQKEYPYLASADINYITNKLGYLEDLEDELGIPLEVLFKALEDGFYFKEEDWKSLNHSAGADDMVLWKTPLNDYQIRWSFTRYVYTRDYGVTWALTKEELE